MQHMIDCTFENGRKASLRHVVVDAIVVKNQKSLLIRRAPHLINGSKWAIPGGFLNRGETLEQAVIRELKEETGLEGKITKLFKIIDSPKRKNEDRQNVAFIYEVKAEGELKFNKEEVSEAKWFDVSNLPKEQDFAFDHYKIIQDFLAQRTG